MATLAELLRQVYFARPFTGTIAGVSPLTTSSSTFTIQEFIVIGKLVIGWVTVDFTFGGSAGPSLTLGLPTPQGNNGQTIFLGQIYPLVSGVNSYLIGMSNNATTINTLGSVSVSKYDQSNFPNSGSFEIQGMYIYLNGE